MWSVEGRSEGNWEEKRLFTLNTLHFSTFICDPEIAGRIVRVERGREEPEVGGPLQGDYGATMGKLWGDYGRAIVMGWRMSGWRK